MAMFIAKKTRGGERFEFRSLDALARRLGGKPAEWSVRNDMSYTSEDDWRVIQVVRRNRRAGGWDIVDELVVPLEAIPASKSA